MNREKFHPKLAPLERDQLAAPADPRAARPLGQREPPDPCQLAYRLARHLAVPLPLPVIAGLLFVSTLGFGYMLGIQQAFLDSVPPQLRGQAFGLNSTGLMGGQGLLPSAGSAAGRSYTGAVRLSLVTIVVQDYDQAVGFFTGVLGFELAEDSPCCH
jgi:hypothetical protein